MTAPDSDLHLRQYNQRDGTAVWRLHELAMEPTATDPADIPGTEDLRDVEGAYLETGGGFLVGVLPGVAADDPAAGDAPAVHDGLLVAMGGVLPNEAGHEDERSVAGAAELHRMRVAPASQRRGYGRELLHALERWARNAGFDPLLATTARTQPAAVEFYREEGYEVAGESMEAGYELVHFEKSLR